MGNERMRKNKSSRVFFIQRRWSDIFSLYSRINNWLGTTEIKGLLTTKNFPCLGELKLKDMAQDKIRITIEILEEDATIKRCGPIHRGVYFRKTKREKCCSIHVPRTFCDFPRHRVHIGVCENCPLI